jgi:hypothetical protein
MRKQISVTTMLLMGLAVCLPLAPTKGQMRGASGQRPSNAAWHKLPGLLYPASDGLWGMSDRAGAFAGTAAAQAVATGGPDDFGYTWDDSVPFAWIDATSGTDTGMSGDSWWQRFGPVNLPFAFKYYENTYAQVYIAASGYVAFTDEGAWNSQSRLPSPNKPNNVVAPYWAPLKLATNGPRGRVYYKSGGAPPNRYFVVEWHQVTDAWRQESTFTFEVILYENGDILFQYATMNGNACGHAGIEDSAGLDGLAYGSFCQRYPSNKAVRFSRPAPSARVQVRPPFQGQFVAPGEIVAFQQPIRNTGELGTDTYDLTVTSSWPVSLLATDGTTLLTDTDGDGVVDTGPLAERSFTTVTVMIQTPPEAGIGDYTTVSVKVQSSLNPRKQKTATLRAAIAAPFAQVFRVYRGRYDDVNLYLVKPTGQALKRFGSFISGVAVAETPDGNFVCAWSTSRESTPWLATASIEYAVFDPYGNLTRPVSNLTDPSGATVDTYDFSLAVAVAPNGQIGVLWQRLLYDRSSGQYNYNVYFAILDPVGNVVVPPTNLTNNAGWGLNAPQFWSPRIAATTDNRFMLAWTRSHADLSDIYYAVRDTSGAEVRKITKLTDSTGVWDGYYRPTLTALSPDRVLLASERGDGDIYFAVLDSSGNLLRYWQNLSNDAWSRSELAPDAVQLSDGRIVVAWTSDSRIRFAVLDRSYNRIAGPITLDNPAAVTGDDYVSVTADASGRAILTWMDADSFYRRNLYYALVDGKGKVLTPPMIFRTSPTSIQTSYEGYGNTSYSRYD